MAAVPTKTSDSRGSPGRRVSVYCGKRSHALLNSSSQVSRKKFVARARVMDAIRRLGFDPMRKDSPLFLKGVSGMRL